MPVSRQRITKQNKQIAKKLITFTISLILILLFRNWGPISASINFIQSTFSTIGTTFYTIYEVNTASPESLAGQLQICESDRNALASDKAYVTILESRIAELEELLNYKQSVDANLVLAHVLAKNIKEDAKILINQGERAGINIGMPVIAENGHIIGTISKTTQNTSTAQLLSSPESKITAMLQSDEATIGIVEGKEGFYLELGFIPQEKIITEGTLILTSGLQDDIPAGLIIGIIREIIKNETALFQTANIEPLIDVNTISRVLIETSPSI